MKLMMMNAPLELVRAFGETEHEVLAVDHPSFADFFASLPSNIRFLPFHMPRKIDPAIFQLRRWIKEYQPDILHPYLSQTLAAGVLSTICLTHAPKLISWRGITRVPSRWDPANHISFLSPRIAFHACESNAVRASLTRGGISDSLCETVYNCVRPDSLTRLDRETLDTFSIPRGAFVVGTVASIRPVKGIDILLEAALACHDLENVYFLIVGPQRDPKVARLLKNPRLAQRVRMAGMVRGASSLMSLFDLFVMPSRQEGLCRALLEAMGQGVCPLVSDAGGMKEVVRHEVDGIVFPKEDPQALEKVIRALHADRARIADLACSARQRMLDMCTPEQMRDRLMRIYRRFDPAISDTATISSQARLA